jgi:hypothetical protein
MGERWLYDELAAVFNGVENTQRVEQKFEL